MKISWMNRFSVLLASVLTAGIAQAAAPAYQVNMRVGLKGQTPISFNTLTKPGKKSFISEFSDDGQTETLIELKSRQGSQNSKEGLRIDVKVTKRVRGQTKSMERMEIFAPDNQEQEVGAKNLSLAVMAHQL